MFDVKPMTPALRPDLATLFASDRSANGCWCMWFIIPVKEYHDGGSEANRAKFTELVMKSKEPLGLPTYKGGAPVGWCAVGPKSRYTRAVRTPTLKGGDPAEDSRTWFVPCFFVHADHRRSGVTKLLLEHAVSLAAKHGASSVEGFPFSGEARRSSGDKQVGREAVFVAGGFSPSRRPSKQRVVMRRDIKAP